MRGRSQAVMVAAAAAVVSLLVPLIGLISSATVALVTLRKGVSEGLVVVAFAGLASGLLAFVALGSPIPAVGFALALWLPIWILAIFLRQSRSLDLTIQLAVLFGLVIVEPVRQNLVESGVVDAVVSEQLMARVSRWMTGAFAATFYFQLLLALFIGRWWQALLYNPGGFGIEFRAIRVQPGVGYLALCLLALVLLLDQAMWPSELLLLLAPLFFLQGVAIIHSLAHAYSAGRAWLIGFYALLVLVMPYTQILVAALGFLDIWMNLRTRMAAQNKGED